VYMMSVHSVQGLVSAVFHDPGFRLPGGVRLGVGLVSGFE
jgi:hypothetical protein